MNKAENMLGDTNKNSLLELKILSVINAFLLISILSIKLSRFQKFHVALH